MPDQHLTFEASGSSGAVSAILRHPLGAKTLLILAHGAGAGMEHPFLEDLCTRLAGNTIATLRYNFPYKQAGRKVPNPKPILLATVRSALAVTTEVAGDLQIFMGGKSMGGRMTSEAAAREALPGVRGLVFVGFPMHAPGKPGTERADHLREVAVPMLFLQGTRDPFADLTLLEPIIDELGEKATLHIVQGGDHSFKVLKRSGRTADEGMQELADVSASWMLSRIRQLRPWSNTR